MKKKILVFCTVLISQNLVASDCDYKVNVPALSYTVSDVNPSVPGLLTILRDKDEGNKCNNFFFAFTKGWSGSYNRRAQNLSNGEVLFYNLYKNNNGTGVLKEPSDITSANDVIFGTIAKNQTKNFNYHFLLAPQSSGLPPKAGTYIDVIQVQTYSGFYFDIERFEGFKNLNIYINVPKSISLSLVDSGESHDETKSSKTLDFGELEEQESQNFDVRVLSNADYILKVSSNNNGQLSKLGGSGPNSFIAYDFYSHSTLRSLNNSSSNPVTIATFNGQTPAGGAQVPIKIVIKSVTDKAPGNYQDFLTLSVISND